MQKTIVHTSYIQRYWGLCIN